jgi:tripartite-type tricarboxylate transporter receptor subunit TctC
LVIAWVAALMVTGAALAQDKYPSKPVSGIVPASAGGSTDLMSRAIEKVWPKYGAQPSEFNSLPDMMAWAKKENKPITTSVSMKAGAQDITITAIAKAAGVNIVTVPFAGGADAVTALAGGHVMLGAGHPSEVAPHIKAGRFKPLAMALPQRDPSLPDIPTLKEQGINVSTWGSVKGVGAPAGTPVEVVAYLEATLKKVTEDEEFKKIMADLNQPVMYLTGPISRSSGRRFTSTTASLSRI